MKNLFIYSGLALALLFNSCKKDDLGPAASNLDASTIQVEELVGAIKLKWSIPDNANYKYIEVKYHHPKTKKEHLRLASIHADTIRIDGLLRSYGDIEYRLTPVTAKGARGTTHKVSATCLALPAVKKVVPNSATQITLDASTMWTDSNQDGDGGGLPAIIDGQNNTYWHMKWNGGSSFPHYLVTKFAEPISGAISFYWKGRDHNNKNNPKKIEVWGSNTAFTGSTNNTSDFNLDNYSATLLATIEGMPDGKGAEYNSPAIILENSYTHIWIKVLSAHGSSDGKHIALSEWKYFKHKVQIYDPETGQTTEL